MATKADKLALRAKGMTYKQIAEHLGISKQAVQQTISEYDPRHFRYVKESGCVYVGLRNWMNDNKVGVSELLRRCGYCNYSGNNATFRSYLTGMADPHKRTIDRILKVTGLTYEEAFGKDGADGEQ